MAGILVTDWLNGVDAGLLGTVADYITLVRLCMSSAPGSSTLQGVPTRSLQELGSEIHGQD